MCAALNMLLEAGHYILITDEDDTLSWERDSHAGWWKGLYPDPDVHPGADGPTRWDQTSDTGVPAPLALVDRIMGRRG